MTKPKALCVATRCTTPEQFIETFHRFCDEQSFFVATLNMRPVGLETPFSIQLADKTPVLQGLCVVLAAWTTANNQFKRPGIRLGIRRLTPESEDVFYQLQAMRTAAPLEIVSEASEAQSVPIPTQLPPLPTAPRGSPPSRPPPSRVESKPEPVVPRTPGSELVLPANPLHNLSDESLEGFVDCTLYEETATFFRSMEDDGRDRDEPIPPPPPAKPVPRAFDLDEPPAFRSNGAVVSEIPPEDSTSYEEVSVMKVVRSRPTGEAAPFAREDTPVVDTPSPFRQDTRAQPPPIPTPVSERVTPVPAGEAYARPVAPPKGSKWWLLGVVTVAASAAAVLVVVTRSSADESPPVEVAKVEKPVAATDRVTEPPAADRDPAPADDEPVPADKPAVADAPTPADEPAEPPEIVDGEEVAAINNPNVPVVGAGPCQLEVTTTPAGTMVRLDDKTIGPSPITIAGECGRRRVDLKHPRYKAEQRFVTLAADKPGTLDVTLVRPTHTLTVITRPAGAKISIGGRRAGTSPTKLQLMGFSGIEVKIEKAGFETYTTRVYSKVPEDKLSVTLKRSLFFK